MSSQRSLEGKEGIRIVKAENMTVEIAVREERLRDASLLALKIEKGAKEFRWPLEKGKSKEIDSSLESAEGTQA